MKEYNWHEERKKYQRSSISENETKQVIIVQPAPRSNSKIFVIVFACLLICGGIFFALRNNNSQIEIPNAIPTEPAPAPQPTPAPAPAPQPTPAPVPSNKSMGVDTPEIQLYYESSSWTGWGFLKLIDPEQGRFYNRFAEKLLSAEDLEGHPEREGLKKLALYMQNACVFFNKMYNYKSYDNKNSVVRGYYDIKTGCVSGEYKNKVIREDNAFYNSGYDSFSFSKNLIYQDIVTHEFSHAVTNYRTFNGRESLIYALDSGALNEAFSDIFACLQKIENNPGLSKEKRWRIGDEVSLDFFDVQSGKMKKRSMMRDLADPSSVRGYNGMRMPEYYLEPDKWLSVYMPDDTNDYGGVHHNMSVVCKMAYLLCEGGYFRGQHIQAMGPAKIGKLFWQLQDYRYVNSRQSFKNLADKMIIAAKDAGFTYNELNNVKNACLAVNLPVSPQIQQNMYKLNSKNNLAVFYYAGNWSFRNNLSAGLTIDSEDACKKLFDGEEIGEIYVRLDNSKDNPFRGMKFSGDDTRFSNIRSVPTPFAAGAKIYHTSQRFSGMPVFGTSAIICTNRNGAVAYFEKDFSKNLNDLKVTTKTFPDSLRKNLFKGQEISVAENCIFDPSLFNMSGKAAVTWMINTQEKRYFVDQNSGKIMFSYPLVITN